MTPGLSASRAPANRDRDLERSVAVALEASRRDVERTEQEWPEKVELLFDRERPIVDQRIGVDVRGEVVGRAVDEEPVRNVQKGRFEGVDRRRNVCSGRDRGVDDRGDQQCGEGRRKQTTHTSGVEAPEPNSIEGTQIAHQQLRHQVPRQHKEHVDTDEAAREPIDAGVEQHYEIDGEGAQAVQVWSIARSGGRNRDGLRHLLVCDGRHGGNVLRGAPGRKSRG
jgi:hypothetical protein